MRLILFTCIVLIMSSLIGGDLFAGTCKVPRGRTYKTVATQTSEIIAISDLKVTKQTQGKYVKIVEDKTELDRENNWAWVKFIFENASNKPIATISVAVVFYDESGKAVHESETLVYNNRSCTTNHPLYKKGYPANAMGFIQNVPPEAVKLEWHINKIGIAIAI